MRLNSFLLLLLDNCKLFLRKWNLALLNFYEKIINSSKLMCKEAVSNINNLTSKKIKFNSF